LAFSSGVVVAVLASWPACAFVISCRLETHIGVKGR